MKTKTIKREVWLDYLGDMLPPASNIKHKYERSEGTHYLLCVKYAKDSIQEMDPNKPQFYAAFWQDKKWWIWCEAGGAPHDHDFVEEQRAYDDGEGFMYRVFEPLPSIFKVLGYIRL